jgi:serine/tyrosine/threonine adenylyltransferase
MKNISEINFKNDFVERFPGDESGDLSPRQTPGMLYSKALPTPVANVSLSAWSDELAEELELARPTTQRDRDILGGNIVTPTMIPYAACYAGHQFGSWAGQLGDGRAITLGEHVTAKGTKWELQLKGAGPTAYSRRGDGRAVLRSSVREYLISEAMYYLRVPTTRALSLVTTGEQVLRDMFYDGHPAYEPGAIVMRVAPCFLRFGNFEILAARGETENLENLVKWTIDNYYPHIQDGDRIIPWFKEVVHRTAKLMVEWHRVGFVHGVMNTDNMSILGLTIDYGPYSFVDHYDPLFTPNTTDLPGRRYAFARQAAVAKWNLGCLAGALLPLVDGEEQLVAALESYDEVYGISFYNMMTAKLGLDKVGEEEVQLISDLERMLSGIHPDMTIFYQRLIDLPLDGKDQEEVLGYFSECFYHELSGEEQAAFSNWVRRYSERRGANAISKEESIDRMRMSNPRFILRNYLLHQAIERLEAGDDTLFVKLQAAIKDPYSNKHDEFLQKRPAWASQKAGCSMLSCSS